MLSFSMLSNTCTWPTYWVDNISASPSAWSGKPASLNGDDKFLKGDDGGDTSMNSPYFSMCKRMLRLSIGSHWNLHTEQPHCFFLTGITAKSQGLLIAEVEPLVSHSDWSICIVQQQLPALSYWVSGKYSAVRSMAELHPDSEDFGLGLSPAAVKVIKGMFVQQFLTSRFPKSKNSTPLAMYPASRAHQCQLRFWRGQPYTSLIR